MTEKYQQVFTQILQSEAIVITSHKGPDGDSIGSSLGLFHFLKKLDKNVTVCHPDIAPDYLRWLVGAEEIVNFDIDPFRVKSLLGAADLIFCLDYNAANRLGAEMETLLTTSSATKVMIDHHPFPMDFCEIQVSDSDCCSTAQLIFELIDQSVNVDMVDALIGTPLYLGIMTDTGSFRYPSVTSRTHQIISELIKSGVNHSMVHERVFDSNTLDRLQLKGYAISEKFEKLDIYPVALICLSQRDLDRFNFKKGDTEGLVNVALSVEGIKVAVFFMEREGEVKISFRSKDNFYVNDLAMKYFSGGGHKYAAGGISYESLDATVAKFKKLVPQFFSQ